MELSKVHDGFVVDDCLIIKAQVQVIRFLIYPYSRSSVYFIVFARNKLFVGLMHIKSPCHSQEKYVWPYLNFFPFGASHRA